MSRNYFGDTSYIQKCHKISGDIPGYVTSMDGYDDDQGTNETVWTVFSVVPLSFGAGAM